MAQLFQPPHVYVPSSDGTPQAGAQAYFYITGTTTPKNTYSDSALSVPNTNPVIADSNGLFGAIYMATDVNYRVTLRTSVATGSALIYTQDDVPGPVITAADIGTSLQPATTAETATGLTLSLNYPYGDVRRFGIIPNSSGAATANTAALVALLNPAIAGPTGLIAFPNTTGADVYYFNGMADVRVGVALDLCGSTLNFTKTYAGADDTRSFLNVVRDVQIYNGNIVVSYNGTGGTGSPGCAIRIGSRNGYSWGSYTSGVTDETLTYPQGKIVLRNLYITSNNPATSSKILFGLGGLDGVIIDNVQVDGQSVVSYGIYYEFGHWHYEATAANIKSSHARNFSIRNFRATNLLSSAGTGVEIVGAGSVEMDGIFVYTAKNGVIVRSGEALFYNKGTPDVNLKPFATLRNINLKAITTTGITLQGAESASGGYLASVISGLGHPGDYVAQTDLISFSLDGFSVDAGGIGVKLQGGKSNIANGSFHGASTSGQVVWDDECTHAVFTNVRITDSSSVGVRANFGGAIWSPARLKFGTFTDCLIAGNTGVGISIQNSRSVSVNNTRFGYNTAYDTAAEATQTNAISVSATGGAGVIANGCYVTTSGGAVAYNNAGTGSNGCGVVAPLGTITFTGTWERNDTNQATATQIADKTSFVNVTNKYLGKRCYDSSNTRLMVAQGSTDVSTWIVADGSATVTPS